MLSLPVKIRFTGGSHRGMTFIRKGEEELWYCGNHSVDKAFLFQFKKFWTTDEVIIPKGEDNDL